MAAKLLLPVLAMVVCTAAQAQRSASVSGTSSYSRSYNVSAGASRTYSSGHSSGGHSSYASPSRSSSSNYASGGFRNTRNFADSYSGTNRYETTERPNRDVYSLSSMGSISTAMMDRELGAPMRNAYLVMDDKYALTPIPKSVPTSNDRVLRGINDGHGSVGYAWGTGLQGTPFYTPGFSSSCANSNTGSEDYSQQRWNFRSTRNLYGLPWYSWAGRQALYRYYWTSNLRLLCSDYLQQKLSHAQTPAEVAEAIRAYYGCVRARTGEDELFRLYYMNGHW